MLVFTRNGENAMLHISGRGAPALDLNLKRENAKWILLDDAPESKLDIFSFTIHDFMLENNSVSGTASEICSMLKEKFPQQEINCNWLYRDLLQHDDEIRILGIDYGKTKSNGIHKIFINYTVDRDSSGGKILCTENAVPAAPENVANADDCLIEIGNTDLPSEENTVPAVPVEQTQGDALIAMAAEMMKRNLAKDGIIVPTFSAD